MIFLGTLLLSVLITIAMVPVCTGLAVRFYLLDIPDERKVHSQPTPRIGGIAIILGSFTPILVWNRSTEFIPAYLAGAGVLALVGIIDDFRGLTPWAKLAGQLVAAAIAVRFGGIVINNLGTLLPEGYYLPEPFRIALTILAIVGVTNAINLSDGLDGLAGGICLLILAGIGYLAYLDDNAAIGLLSLALSGALFGFLRFNTHPASIFMGDVGSQFLGFSVIVLSLALTQGQPTALSPVLPLILLGFPVLDTLTVMVTRIATGRSPFAADKNHFHHNLMAFGFRHAESVLIIYAFQTVLLMASVIFRYYSDWLLLTGYLLFSALVLTGFSLAARTELKMKRFDLLDLRISERLRLLKNSGAIIRPTFRIFELGIPLLLLSTCLMAANPPFYVSAICGFMAVLLMVIRFFYAEKLETGLRIVLYILIPFAVYLSDDRLSTIMNETFVNLYNISFGVFAVLIILITKFSRRQKGFHSSPMDFLIIILALVVPNMPDEKIQEYQMGLIAAKIILLYFSYEVLMAELRGKYNRVALATVASLLVLAVK